MLCKAVTRVAAFYYEKEGKDMTFTEFIKKVAELSQQEQTLETGTKSD